MHCEGFLVSKLFYKIAKYAVGELAKNPELQIKAATFVKERIVPDAKAELKKAKPKLKKAKTTIISATNEIAGAARAIDPTQDPKKFFHEASKRLRDRLKI